MHFCQDEAAAIAASIPFLGYFIIKARHLWHRIWHRNEVPAKDGCCDGHEHK